MNISYNLCYTSCTFSDTWAFMKIPYLQMYNFASNLKLNCKKLSLYLPFAVIPSRKYLSCLDRRERFVTHSRRSSLIEKTSFVASRHYLSFLPAAGGGRCSCLSKTTFWDPLERIRPADACPRRHFRDAFSRIAAAVFLARSLQIKTDRTRLVNFAARACNSRNWPFGPLLWNDS